MILVYFGRVMFLGGKQPGLASTRGWGRFPFQEIPPASGAFVLPVKVPQILELKARCSAEI